MERRSSTSLWAVGRRPSRARAVDRLRPGMLAPATAHLRMDKGAPPSRRIRRSDSCPGSIRRIARRLHLTSHETLGCLGVPGCLTRWNLTSATCPPKCSTSCLRAPFKARFRRLGRAPGARSGPVSPAGDHRCHSGLRDRSRRPDDDHPVLPVRRALGRHVALSDEFTEPATKQALVDTQLLTLSPPTVALSPSEICGLPAALDRAERACPQLRQRDPRDRFATVRQRVARQLLDLASTHQQDSDPNGELAVRITQQDLAEAVGTVREVVVRTLRQLRDAGVVRTERDRIVLLDPAQLTEEVKWNISR